MTLLEQMNVRRAAQRESMRLRVRAELRSALREMAPGRIVTIFGSLTRPGKFNEYSDVDLALDEEWSDPNTYQLSAILGERLGRRIDVVLLTECRFKKRLVSEGEVWILKD